MTDRKPRPLWPFLTAALIGLPVLYVVSFGPACWLVEHGFPARPAAFIYEPLLRQALLKEGPVREALHWYGSKFSARGMVDMGFYGGIIEGGMA